MALILDLIIGKGMKWMTMDKDMNYGNGTAIFRMQGALDSSGSCIKMEFWEMRSIYTRVRIDKCLVLYREYE